MRRASRWRWSLIGVCAVAGGALVRHLAGYALESKLALETVAIVRADGSFEPELYGARAAKLPGFSPMFRLSPDEPFAAPTRDFQRFMVPASRVRGFDPVDVEVRYRNILGEVRTRRLTMNVREALSNARTLFLFEGQKWACVADRVGGADLVFEETSDRAATVSYAVDGGRETKLPEGVRRVALASRPAHVTVVVRTCDGDVFSQRIEGDAMILERRRRGEVSRTTWTAAPMEGCE